MEVRFFSLLGMNYSRRLNHPGKSVGNEACIVFNEST